MSATRQALPTATGFAVKCAITALRQRSADPGPLLHRAGLAEGDLGASQRRVSAAAQGAFLEYAALALNNSAFGLHLAEQSNPREVGLLFYAMSAAENVSEALALLMRYCRIVNESVRLKLAPQPDGIFVEASFRASRGMESSKMQSSNSRSWSRRSARSPALTCVRPASPARMGGQRT